MLRNYNKKGQKLPLFGVGPYMIFGMGALTLIGIILFGYVLKIGALNSPWILIFRIAGAVLIISGIVIWFVGALRSDMDNSIESNKLKTDGIYAWVRNPMYSGWWIAFAGITLMWHNIWMLVLPFINWIIMTITLINSEEKWLSELYGTEYELKFVSELSHEHYLKCACYMVAKKLKKGILWNVRTNDMYEISIPDKTSFLDCVTKTITKHQMEKYHKPKGGLTWLNDLRS